MQNQKEFFGVEKLSEILDKEGIQNAFLVTGSSSYESSAAKQKLEQIFQKKQINFFRFSSFTPNPKLEEIKKGYDLFEKGNFDSIIAVGGGSAIDVGKAIKLFYFNHSSKKVPLVAIPTTSGSGSEATHFIVYYTKKEKQSKGDPNITLPDYSILDPSLTMFLPREIAASSGIDALSQAVESYWSINSSIESKKYASKAITLLMSNLEKSVNNPDNESKKEVMIAANLAGKAINITKTTACHSLAYPLTSYFGISHGHAAGLSLGEFLVYNQGVSEFDCADKRGYQYVQKAIAKIAALLESKSPEEASFKIKGLMSSIGLKTRLSDLGLCREDLNLVLKNGFSPERVRNNPRFLSEKGLSQILANIF